MEQAATPIVVGIRGSIAVRDRFDELHGEHDVLSGRTLAFVLGA
ncbi:hypothetical protein [Amycolatopsis sp. CA-230715]|nr:hypothetical protein [Amycolatopsis sp. CA-230715]